MNPNEIAAQAKGVLGTLLRQLHKTDAEKAKRRLCSKCDDERPFVVYDADTGNVNVLQATQVATHHTELEWMTPEIREAAQSMERKDMLVVMLQKNGDTHYYGFRNV
jgi:hypothetical protein